MIITRATEYAIRAVLYMSRFPTGDIVLKKDICRTQDVTPAFLTKIFQPMIKEGIIGSQRGVGGGFYLKKEPKHITLYDIFEIQEDPLYLNKCLIEEGNCARDTYCPVHSAWENVREKMIDQLRLYDFARLAAEEKENIQKRIQTRNNCAQD
ncbi:MAG: transcriptional regulator [Desulfobacteraceae bacterium 4572_35.1]|nr:MAG: transcriptional regulator [Desulfobacteraceae bacterium 4572_35.1]